MKTTTQAAEAVDVNKILNKLLANKLFIIACAAVGVGCAWLFNVYSVPTYLVTASIIAKGEKEGVITEILKGKEDNTDVSSLFTSRDRNIADEIAVIRSKPLLEKVLQRPEFRIRYYEKGKFIDFELYKAAPFVVVPVACEREPKDPVYLVYHQTSGFRLGDEKTVATARIYAWGDTVKLSDKCSCMISQRPGIEQPAVANPPDVYYFQMYSLADVVQAYATGLQIPEPKNTYVIKLNINSTHPERDKDFLNLLMAEYINEKIDRKSQAALKTIEFIDAQLGDITKSLLKVEDRLESFKRSNKLASGYMNTNTFFDKAAELEREKTKLLLMENYIDYIDKYMKESDEYDKILTPSSANVEDKVLNELVSELVQLQLEKNTYLRNAKEKNPFLTELNNRIANVKKSLQEAVVSVRATNTLALRNIEAQIKAAEASAGALPQKEREFVGINRLYTVNENVYVMLLQKRLEADLMRAAATVDSRVVEEATLDYQIGPKKIRNYGIGLSMGLLIPFGFIFLTEFFRGTIENVDELARISQIPLLGSVTHIKNKDNKSTIILDKPKSSLAESFRALRSNLNFVLGNDKDGGKVILVTSSIAGEGKSFCSVNIALVLALSGKKVICVMADMRKPKLSPDLVTENINTGQGLSTYLSQLAELDQVITPSVIQMLDLITAGPIPPNPSELLLSKQMELLIAELKKRYDYIIIDTPPIGLVSDPMNLIQYSDANLYVVRYKYTPAEKIKYINKIYTEGQINKLSFIFNDVRSKAKGYGYYED